MAKMRNLLIGVGLDQTKLKQMNADLRTVKRNFRRDFGAIQDNLKQTGRRMSMSLTAPLALLGAQAFKTFAKFEGSMAKVQAVTGATAAEFSQLTENAKKLGKSTRFSATQVAGLQVEFGKLGFSAAEITKVTQATLALAQATGSDLARAAEVAGATLRGFGLEADETGRVTDVMAMSFSSSALDMESFAESMKHVAPLAKAAGVSIEEASAMLSSMADAGIKGSLAGTALKRILLEMEGGSGTLAEKIAALSMQEMNLADASSEVGDRAAAALIVLKDSVKQTSDLTKSYQGAAGSAQEMADIMDDTAEGAMFRMTSALEGMMIVIGESLAPMIVTFSEYVADLAAWFAGLGSTTRGVVIVLGAMLAAIGPILMGVSLMMPAIAGITLGLGKLKMAQLALNAAMLLNPYVLAAAGLVAFVAVVSSLSGQTTTATTDTKNFLTALEGVGKQAALNAAEEHLRGLQRKKAAADKLAETAQEMQSIAGLGDKYGRLASSRTIERQTANAKDFTKAIELAQIAVSDIRFGGGAVITLDDGSADDGSAGDVSAELTDKQIAEAARAAAAKLALAISTSQAIAGVEDDLYKLRLDKYDALELEAMQEADARALIAQDNADLMRQIEQQLIVDLAAIDAIRTADVAAAAEAAALATTEANAVALEEWQVNADKMKAIGLTIGNAVAQSFEALVSGAEDAGEQIKKIFKQMILGAISTAISNAIASAFSPVAPDNLATGGVAGAAKVGGFLAMINSLIPKFKDGGIVSGPTVGMMGEYAGAKANPEVIAPLSKLKSMLGGQGGGRLTGTISGRDILLASHRDQRGARRTYTAGLI